MPVKFTVNVDQASAAMIGAAKRRAVATAAVAALRETTANAVQEGRADIASAGRFSGGWVKGLQYLTKDATQGGEPSLQAKAIIFHKIGLAGVFEFGATIEGKPLLWIPTQRGAPTASKSGKKLTSATINGQPMLFDADDKNRERKPLYIGVPSVRIPKKFHITEIVKKHVLRFSQLFLKHFKDN